MDLAVTPAPLARWGIEDSLDPKETLDVTDVKVEQAVPDARVQLGQPDKLDTQGGLESQAPSALQDEPGKQAPQGKWERREERVLPVALEEQDH